MNIIRNILKNKQHIIRLISINTKYKKTGVNLLLSTAYMKQKFKDTDQNNVAKLPEELTSLIKTACKSSENKISDLIVTVETAVQITCEKYRTCLQKQIKILKEGMSRDPLSDYWDNMVALRSEAADLKLNLEKYQSLVEYVGQIANNIFFCNALLDNYTNETINDIQEQFKNLQKICEQEMGFIKQLEEVLTEVNALYIMSVDPK